MTSSLDAFRAEVGSFLDEALLPKRCFKGHEWYERTAKFCEKYDQTAFDPDYDAMPLAAFEPMVHRIPGVDRLTRNLAE